METLYKAVDFFRLYPTWAQWVAVLLPILSFLILATVPRLDAKGVLIEEPAPDAPVPQMFVVKGRYTAVPTDNVLWLMTSDRQGSRLWPQQRITPNADKSWSATAKKIGGDPGTTRTFGVYSVGLDGQALLEMWEIAVKLNPKLEIRKARDITPAAERTVIVAPN